MGWSASSPWSPPSSSRQLWRCAADARPAASPCPPAAQMRRPESQARPAAPGCNPAQVAAPLRFGSSSAQEPHGWLREVSLRDKKAGARQSPRWRPSITKAGCAFARIRRQVLPTAAHCASKETKCCRLPKARSGENAVAAHSLTAQLQRCHAALLGDSAGCTHRSAKASSAGVPTSAARAEYGCAS